MFIVRTYSNINQRWQFTLLSNGMKNLGFELEYEEGVDKLRSLLAQKLCFSKNQNGVLLCCLEENQLKI